MQATQNKESLLISLVTRMLNKSIMITAEQKYPDEDEAALDTLLQLYIEAGGKEEDMFNLEVIKEASEKVQPSV